jgi:hypothetical protein
MENNKVRSISFTNKTWSTAEGISLENYLSKEFSHLISCEPTIDNKLLVCSHVADGLEFDMRLTDGTEFGLVTKKLNLSLPPVRSLLPPAQSVTTPAVQRTIQTPVKPSWDEQYYLCTKEAHSLIANPSCAGEGCMSAYLAVAYMKRNHIDSCMKAHGYTVQWNDKK